MAKPFDLIINTKFKAHKSLKIEKTIIYMDKSKLIRILSNVGKDAKKLFFPDPGRYIIGHADKKGNSINLTDVHTEQQATRIVSDYEKQGKVAAYVALT